MDQPVKYIHYEIFFDFRHILITDYMNILWSERATTWEALSSRGLRN